MIQQNTLLDRLRHAMLELEANTGKKPSLMALPRDRAHELIQAYAAATEKPLMEQHAEALSVAKSKAPLLLVIDGIPVYACDFDNGLQIIAGWVWPARQSLREVEESPQFPGLPWFPGVAHSPEDLMHWCQTAINQADQLTKEHPARYMAPVDGIGES